MSQRCRQFQFLAGGAMIVAATIAITLHFGWVALARAADAPKAAAPAAAAPAVNPDEQAIRATADAFVKAFNAGDAKTIGTQWTADAQYTDESGQTFVGAGEIEKAYASLFKQYPGAKATVFIDSIQFLGPDIAIEKGIAKVTPAKGSPSASRYHVVHARRDGKWVMVVGHDSPYVSAFDDDYLKDLAWLVGDWKSDAKDQPLRMKFDWMAQRNFIRNTYQFADGGKSALTGGQMIGWDPKTGHIVSWHFDAEGGFGHDTWTEDGMKWIIRAHGTLRDGSDSQAVNILTQVDPNAFTWQSTKRTLDGVNLPDVPPIKMVRVEQKSDDKQK